MHSDELFGSDELLQPDMFELVDSGTRSVKLEHCPPRTEAATLIKKPANILVLNRYGRVAGSNSFVFMYLDYLLPSPSGNSSSMSHITSPVGTRDNIVDSMKGTS